MKKRFHMSAIHLEIESCVKSVKVSFGNSTSHNIIRRGNGHIVMSASGIHNTTTRYLSSAMGTIYSSS